MKTKGTIIWIILLIAYLSTRLLNLKIIPIFTDEAIYLNWAQIALNDPAHRFISLEDGKQPLFIWLVAIVHKFIQDPLIALRLVSVFAGLGSMIAIFLLTDLLFKNKKMAYFSSILYIILPFTLLYDRMGIYDSLLTMFGLYSIYFTVKMAIDPKLDIALLNGFAIGFGLITKSSALLFLYMIPFSLLLFDFSKKQLANRLFRWAGLGLVTVILSELMYNALRLSPLFYIIELKNFEFIRNRSELYKLPLDAFLSNFNSIVSWFISYSGPVLFGIFIIGIIYAVVNRNLKVIYLSTLVLIPFAIEIIFNKILYARFLLFYFPYMIIVMSFTVVKITGKLTKHQNLFLILVGIGIVLPVLTSYMLLTAPPKASIPQNDKNQYINDWPAGYGVSEIVDFLKSERARYPEIYVGTEGTFGLYPYALAVYLRGDSNMHVYGYWPVHADNVPQQIKDFAKEGHKTYFIFNYTQIPVTDPHLKPIAKYQKGSGNSYMRLFEVN